MHERIGYAITSNNISEALNLLKTSWFARNIFSPGGLLGNPATNKVTGDDLVKLITHFKDDDKLASLLIFIRKESFYKRFFTKDVLIKLVGLQDNKILAFVQLFEHDFNSNEWNKISSQLPKESSDTSHILGSLGGINPEHKPNAGNIDEDQVAVESQPAPGAGNEVAPSSQGAEKPKQESDNAYLKYRRAFPTHR